MRHCGSTTHAGSGVNGQLMDLESEIDRKVGNEEEEYGRRGTEKRTQSVQGLTWNKESNKVGLASLRRKCHNEAWSWFVRQLCHCEAC